MAGASRCHRRASSMRKIWIGIFVCALRSLRLLLGGLSQGPSRQVRRWCVGFDVGMDGPRYMCTTRVRRKALTRILGDGVSILTVNEWVTLAYPYLAWTGFCISVFFLCIHVYLTL